MDFITNNNYLTECQKKNLINKKKDRYKYYINQESNKQIKTLYNNIKNNLINLYRLESVINQFVNSVPITKNIMDFIKKNNVQDMDVINMIKKNINKPVKNKDYCSGWTYAIQNLILKYKSINENTNNFKYLDIGCGSGHKTLMFGKYLELNNNNIYGTDIENWGPYDQVNNKHPFNFKFIKQNNILDFDDNTFDFITCILSLHHIKNLDVTLKEIYRILKSNGILLIIEHDNYDSNDDMIIDILHLFHAYFNDKNYNYIKEPLYGKYLNFVEWDYLMMQNNFIYVKGNILHFELSYYSRYDNLFYGFYKKN